MKRPILTFILAMMLLLVGGSQLATAQSGNQWRIDFWPNPDWAGAPVYTQYANFADFTWGEWAPGPNLPSQNYSARLDTDAFFYAGLYRFTVLADDEVRLTINNVTYLDTIGRPQPGKTFVIDIPMAQGMSHVSVDFRQWSGPGYIHVNWQFVKENGGAPVYPTQPPTYVPPAQPPVVSAPSISNKYGDFTPCIQQGSHQKNCFHGSGEWNSPNLGSIEM
ncbi:MAG: hypothetical protein KDD84_19640, partial [Caldilineaceae bacterium]|nr:hypothetical protein [Caldilineaceae bacterium]